MSPVKQICIMRLSALGDVCHALPVVRTLQHHFPQARFTWIIGKVEYQLIGDIPDIDFVIFDKSLGRGAYKKLKQDLHGQRFDLLLHMQTSLRANIAALLIPAKTKLGYDRTRARELHSLVINQRIAPAKQGQHQIDDMFGFAEALGITQRHLEWNIPVPQEAGQFADQQLGQGKWLAINPCSSPSKRVQRSWLPERYAAVADHAMDALGLQVVLVGGPTEMETQAGQEICQHMQHTPLNLIGQTSLKQLCAVLQKADTLLTSDSGPAHIATALGTRVIALHAATNPYQTGPYLNLEDCINKYPQAVQEEYGKPAEQLPWGSRAHGEDVMSLISTQDVLNKLAELYAHTHHNR